MNNFEELKKAALVATPGPWTSQSGYPRMIVSETEKWTHYDDCGNPEFTGPAWVCNVGDAQNNADFISLANPAAILALIAQLEAAQKEISELRDEEQEWLSLADMHEHLNHQNNLNVEHRNKIHSLKEKLLAAEAALSAVNEKLSKPVGYCLMPESLTAENGAKGALSGEFFTETHITCEECGGDCDEDDPCKHCNDLGVQTVRTAIGWSTIKDIYKMAVGATAIRPAGFTVEGE